MENHKSTASPVSSVDPEKAIEQSTAVDTSPQKPVEFGGQKGPEPTRYGDWEKAGRCTDF